MNSQPLIRIKAPRARASRTIIWWSAVVIPFLFSLGCVHRPKSENVTHFTVHRSKEAGVPVAYLSFPQFNEDRGYYIAPEALEELAKLDVISGDIIVKRGNETILNNQQKTYRFPDTAALPLHVEVSSSRFVLLRAEGKPNANDVLKALGDRLVLPVTELVIESVKNGAAPRVKIEVKKVTDTPEPTADLFFEQVPPNRIYKLTIKPAELEHGTALKWVKDGITAHQDGRVIIDSQHPIYTFQGNSSDITVFVTTGAHLQVVGMRNFGGGWEEPVIQNRIIVPIGSHVTDPLIQ